MISINHSSKVITVPQSDLTFVSGALYELNVDTLRLSLKAIEDDADGMLLLDTHRHNPQVTLAGITLARTVEILSPYTVTFQDVGTPYTVRLVGANSNLADVKNVNQVSLIVGNTAGLITVTSGSGVTAQDKLDIARLVLDELVGMSRPAGSFGAAVNRFMMAGTADETIPINPTGTIQAGANSATRFATDLTGVDNRWKDALLAFIDGALAGQVKKITAFAGGVVTVKGGYTGAPQPGDKFTIVNR